MSTALHILDETTSGHRINSFTVACQNERLTVRELIAARICQEVEDYNQHEPECFRGLVVPAEAELTDHGYRLRQRRKIDSNQQCQLALEAFERKGFFVLVGDQVARSLDQVFEIKPDTEVCFVKLSPLVAG